MFRFILPKFHFKIEKWKWNKEYRVYVSNQGHFKNEYKQNLPIKINTNGGYVAVKTQCGYKLAHRLVMLTWAPIPNAEEMTVDHLDHNKRNNAVSNLEWITLEENHCRANADLIKEKTEESVCKIKITNGIETFESYIDAAEWIKKRHKNKKKVKGIAIRLENIMKDSHKKEYFGYVWSFV